MRHHGHVVCFGRDPPRQLPKARMSGWITASESDAGAKGTAASLEKPDKLAGGLIRHAHVLIRRNFAPVVVTKPALVLASLGQFDPDTELCFIGLCFIG